MERVKPTFPGLSHYKAPANYELAGENFQLVLDDGREITLDFIDKKKVQITETIHPLWKSMSA